MNRQYRRAQQTIGTKNVHVNPLQTSNEGGGVRGKAEGVRLLIATPCYGGIHPAYVLSLASALPAFTAAGIEYNLLMKSDAEIVSLRNDLATQCLVGGATDILFIDADQSWRAEDVIRWLRTDLLVVGTPCVKKQNPPVLTCTTRQPREISGGYVRASRLGKGMLLVRRAALESLAVSVTRYVGAGGEVALDFFGTLYPQLPDGSTGRLSEDVSFFTRLDRAVRPTARTSG